MEQAPRALDNLYADLNALSQEAQSTPAYWEEAVVPTTEVDPGRPQPLEPEVIEVKGEAGLVIDGCNFATESLWVTTTYEWRGRNALEMAVSLQPLEKVVGSESNDEYTLAA